MSLTQRRCPPDSTERSQPARSSPRCYFNGTVTLIKRFAVRHQLGLRSFNRGAMSTGDGLGKVRSTCSPIRQSAMNAASAALTMASTAAVAEQQLIGDRPSAGRVRRRLGRCIDGRRFVQRVRTGAMLAGSVVSVGSGSGFVA